MNICKEKCIESKRIFSDFDENYSFTKQEEVYLVSGTINKQQFL